VSRALRGVGWLLLVGGMVVLLYVVYLLWFTNLETERAQGDLSQEWSLAVPDGEGSSSTAAEGDGADGDAGDAGAGEDAGALAQDDSMAPAASASEDDPDGDGADTDGEVAEGAYAAIWFERDGERIVNDEVLYVVEGVSIERLKAGPGRYPGSERPGGEGNLSIAGHRTTYGAPFWSLDELAEGDTIHVQDREGREWVYAYREREIVAPQDVWVLDEDPLGSGEPTVTLTTCHPRGSAAQRLVAWGELVDEPIASSAGDPIRELAGS
jgi:sortase A